MLSEIIRFIKALNPGADAFAGTKNTDIVNMGFAEKMTWLVYTDGGTTGKTTITVEACDDVTPSNTSAVAFRYRKSTAGVTDAVGALTAATTAGFDTTPAETNIYEIEVSASALPVGYPFVRLHMVEAADDPVNGCVIGMASGLRYGGLNAPGILS